MPLVSIITVNYNHPSVTEEMLESIFTKNDYDTIEIIVVDNGSKINPVPAWEKKYSNVLFIRSEKNLGFAGGNNLGIKYAKGELLFLVNNDTEFTTGLVGKLEKVLTTNPLAGIVSPKIHYYNQANLLQYAGYTEMNFYTGRNGCIGQFEKDEGQYKSGETGYAHGAAMMVKKEAIEKAGVMSENFFLYYEELDWCERIKKSGFKIWVETGALIFHKESMSVGKQSALKEYFMNRNRILFERKHASSFAFAVFITYFLLLVVPRNIVSYIKNKQYHFIPLFLKAIWWNFRNDVDSNLLYFPPSK